MDKAKRLGCYYCNDIVAPADVSEPKASATRGTLLLMLMVIPFCVIRA